MNVVAKMSVQHQATNIHLVAKTLGAVAVLLAKF